MDRKSQLISAALGIAAGSAVAAFADTAPAGAALMGLLAGSAATLAAAFIGGSVRGRDDPARDATARGTTSGDPSALIMDLPLPVILIDRAERVLLVNMAARALFGNVAAGTPLSTLIRARPLTEAVETTLAGGAETSVSFTLLRARERRDLVAHLRRLDDTGDREHPAAMILLEDHTRAARIEQMRRDFIANASHELRTPLASIAGFIETLGGPAAGDTQAQGRFLPIMAAQAQRMGRLIDDLLSLNRIEINEHVRPTETVDLAAILHETAAALAPLAEQAGVEIKLAVPKQPLPLTGDRDELSQLFTNLIDNAVKYGGSGGEVTIALAEPEPGRARMVGVTVADKGRGIAREHLPRLTERFYRVSDSRSGGGDGTGLGLSIVKHILSRHRGDLSIRSSPGNGAYFTAWLPREEDAGPGSAA